MTIKRRLTETPPEINWDSLPSLLDEITAAYVLGTSVTFLRRGRAEGCIGMRTPTPPFVRLGGRVMYKADTLRLWVKELSEVAR
jgi:hypothetical protein